MTRLAPVLVPILAWLLAAPAAADPAPAVPADLATYGDDGLRVGDAVLFKGEVAGAALDAGQDLIWFTSKGTVQVIDLRDPKRAPVVILDRMPGAAISISGFSSAEINTQPSQAFAVLTLGKKPAISARQGIYAVSDPDGTKRTIRDLQKKTRLVGGAWIKAQLARTSRTIAAPPARPDPPKVTLPFGGDQCAQTGDCGNAFWLAGTPYQEVIVMGACGDSCYRGCALYDPVKKVFAGLGASSTWGPATADIANVSCADVVADASGGHVFTPNAVCTIDPKRLTCTDLKPRIAFAWITTATAP